MKELEDPTELEGLEPQEQEELLNAFNKYKLLTEGNPLAPEAVAKLTMEDVVQVPQLPCLISLACPNVCRLPHIQPCPLAGQAASDEELAQLPEKSDAVEICTVLKDLVMNRSFEVVIGTGDPSIDRALLGEIVSAKSQDTLQMLAIKKMQAFEPSAALVCRRELESRHAPQS